MQVVAPAQKRSPDAFAPLIRNGETDARSRGSPIHLSVSVSLVDSYIFFLSLCRDLLLAQHVRSACTKGLARIRSGQALNEWDKQPPNMRCHCLLIESLINAVA
jgi:hypothetical protein